MVAQMSKNSKIYHRDGCRFLKRIKEESLIAFDMDDGRIEELKPCKCCCNLKKIYKDYEPELRTVFEDLEIDSKQEENYVVVTTPWYQWRIVLKSLTQEMKLYSEVWDEECQNYFRIQNVELGSTRNLGTVMKFIANEERVATYPVPFRKQALQIEQFAKEKNIQIEYDGTDLYVLTDMAAWKIAYGYHLDWFKLLHCPFDGQALTMEEAKAAHYHVQQDVARNCSPYRHLQYIVKHDAAKKIEQVDYKDLPQRTKKQKKYYRQAENRARRKSVSRVLDIFTELENKGELARV